MLRSVGAGAVRCSFPVRVMSTTSTAFYYKLDNFGRPLNQIPEWIDEGVALPFPGARTTIRSQKFKKQFRKNVI